MTLPAVSVIVVSWDRPDALRRCLTGIAQLDYPDFEVIVVADAAGRAVVSENIKVVACDVPNIAVARNLGIASAAGEVVAFIDDDAVPEPTWLTYLCKPFLDPNMAASGGFVIGRNGISFQWKARMAFPDGSAVPMEVDPEKPTILFGEPGRAIKTEGTNMAFRRDRIVDLGGFDPVFAFYLDETDVNMRLAVQHARVAVVPKARVHHGFAASARRTAARVPRDLSAIGRSLKAFVRKHDPKADLGAIYRAERDSQRRRLLAHMRDGNLMPGQVGRILKSFDKGWADDAAVVIPLPDFADPPAFQHFAPKFSAEPTLVLTGRFWQARRVLAQARATVAQNRRVFVLLLSLSSIYHRVYFDSGGFWVQQGGQFGKSERSGRIVQFWRRKPRIRHEVARSSDIRKIDTLMD